jgi:alpha-tubulin suppressor-like RCC1 family protein
VELPSGVGRIRSVACGGAHSLCVDVKGTAASCGKNEHGRLGLGDEKPNCLTFEVLKKNMDSSSILSSSLLCEMFFL